MKITLKHPKPRAKHINNVLRSKKSEKHKDQRRPTRAMQKARNQRVLD